MKLLPAALVGAAMILFSSTHAAAQAAMCLGRADVVGTLAKGHAEHPVARGLTPAGAVLEVFASASGNFTLVATRPDGLSCLMVSGEGWEALPPPITEDPAVPDDPDI